jgi:hypothetical protein
MRHFHFVAEGKFELDVVRGAVEQKWGACGCLPACTSLTYTVDVFNADLMSAELAK